MSTEADPRPDIAVLLQLQAVTLIFIALAITTWAVLWALIWVVGV
jgi:hypothetical protein